MNPRTQRTAVARLVTACESIISRGLLEPNEELWLRELTNKVCSEFEMVPVAYVEQIHAA